MTTFADMASAPSAVMTLLAAVRARDRLARAMRSAAWACVMTAAIILAFGGACRLCGWHPHVLSWSCLALPPLIAVAWALARCRPMPLAGAARRADGHLGSEDLLLSSCSSRAPVDGFAPVLAAQAAACARAAQAKAIVPLQAWSPMRGPLIALGALALGIALVPTLDPFGAQARLRAHDDERKAIASARQATRARAAEINAAHPEAKVSESVAKDLARIAADLAAMKPQQVNPNKVTLSQDRTELKARLDQLSGERFAHSLDPQGGQQLGGDADHMQARQLADSLEHGKSEESLKALDEAKAIAHQLAQATSAADQQRLAAELGRTLATLQQAAAAHPSGFSAAVQHALDQLGAASDPELKSQALQALADALDLAKLEAESDAQGARDQQGLQQALQALHLADALNESGKLQGSSADMESYAKLYAQMLDQFQYGEGEGEGLGHGGHVPGQRGGGSGHGYRSYTELDDAKVDATFKTEQLHAPLRPGQIVASWTEHGPADAGAMVKAYAGDVAEVKQEVPAALEHEQVPEAYHAGVKKYFDGLPTGR